MRRREDLIVLLERLSQKYSEIITISTALERFFQSFATSKKIRMAISVELFNGSAFCEVRYVTVASSTASW